VSQAEAFLILTTSSKLAGYDKLAWMALTGSLPLFTRNVTGKTLPFDTLPEAGDKYRVAVSA